MSETALRNGLSEETMEAASSRLGPAMGRSAVLGGARRAALRLSCEARPLPLRRHALVVLRP